MRRETVHDFREKAGEKRRSLGSLFSPVATSSDRRPRRPAMGPRQWKYLDPAEMARLKNMEFVARQLVEGYFSGKHRSPDYGYSVEFADHREYAPGDELRSLDWKVFGRTDKLYVKLYEEETNLHVYLLLDKSASMGYGSEGVLSKLEYSSYLAGALAFLMVRQGDRVSLGVFDDTIQRFFRPGGSMPHLFSILNSLEGIKPGKTTKISDSLEALYPLIKRRGLLVVISDFLDQPESLYAALDHFRHRRFEVLLFQTLHPWEVNLPDEANLRFIDMETAETIVAEPRVVRKEYQSEMGKFLEKMRLGAQARRIDYNLVQTDTPYHEVLERYLVKRRAIGT